MRVTRLTGPYCRLLAAAVFTISIAGAAHAADFDEEHAPALTEAVLHSLLAQSGTDDPFADRSFGLLAALSTASPCQEDDRYRQFNFWLGSWDVYNAQRELVGTNDITPAEDGCALIERWTGSRGSTGMSINYLDPSSGTWKQAWVAATGGVIELEGRLDGGAMAMEGTLVKPDGSRTPMRGRWTPLDDGRVRQEFHVPDSSGAWQISFDGYYERTDE